jgi:predicted helicase
MKLSIDEYIVTHDSWDSLWDKMVKDPNLTAVNKGDIFERFTQLYLLTAPEYKSILRRVWRLSEQIPGKIRKKLNLPLSDEGIDLVAETRGGKYWTIQCKFRGDVNRPLTYKELSTFSHLSFVNTKGVEFAIVAHTARKPVRKRHLLSNISEIGLDRWLSLSPDDWEEIRGACQGKKATSKRLKKRAYQRNIIHSAGKHFIKDENARGHINLPCGTGKSLIAIWIAQRLKATSIIVAVPSLALIRQSLQQWTREMLANGIIPDWLCVCSDESVGKVNTDEFVGGQFDMGIKVHTDPKSIENFLKRKSGKVKIVFVTYQSSLVLAKTAMSQKFVFSLAILDEAHKTVGSHIKPFAALLSDKNIRVEKRLFMTATARVISGRKDKVASMDDPKIYGKCFYQMSFMKAIKDNIISDYKVVTIALTKDEIKKIVQKTD